MGGRTVISAGVGKNIRNAAGENKPEEKSFFSWIYFGNPGGIRLSWSIGWTKSNGRFATE
jgi:hypothetical protein